MRALACFLAIAFATVGNTSHARAQAPDRGYGGPETVGPNFSTGKQSAPADYGSGPQNKKALAKPARVKKAVRPSKPAVKAARTTSPKPRPVAKRDPETAPAQTQDKTAAPAAGTAPVNDAPPAATPTQTCRRFDATTSTTLDVPCS